MASYSLARLAALTQLTASAATLYTVTAPRTKAVVKQILVSNTSASSATVTIHIVPALGTASSATKIIPEVSVAANSVITFDVTQVLNVGETLQALASTGSAINAIISGYEVE